MSASRSSGEDNGVEGDGGAITRRLGRLLRDLQQLLHEELAAVADRVVAKCAKGNSGGAAEDANGASAASGGSSGCNDILPTGGLLRALNSALMDEMAFAARRAIKRIAAAWEITEDPVNSDGRSGEGRLLPELYGVVDRELAVLASCTLRRLAEKIDGAGRLRESSDGGTRRELSSAWESPAKDQLRLDIRAILHEDLHTASYSVKGRCGGNADVVELLRHVGKRNAVHSPRAGGRGDCTAVTETTDPINDVDTRGCYRDTETTGSVNAEESTKPSGKCPLKVWAHRQGEVI